MPAMTMRDLITAIDDLVAADGPIVASATVKAWCVERHIDSGVNAKGTGGGHLDRASKDAAKADRLQRWKAGPGRTSNVGWSASLRANPAAFEAARAWAERNGWRLVDG